MAPLLIMHAPVHVLVVLLGSAFRVLALVYFLVFPLPPLPTQGSRRLSLIVCFSIELTVQCDGCLIWGLVWQAGLVAGLRVGQAYGVFHRPGFGLLVPVLRPLSTKPPFVTQALTINKYSSNAKACNVSLHSIYCSSSSSVVCLFWFPLKRNMKQFSNEKLTCIAMYFQKKKNK